jgi:hypothetical protein
MRQEIDRKVADRITAAALDRVWNTPSVCTRHLLRNAIAAATQQAYEIGLLAGQEANQRNRKKHGNADRLPWMDIRLDDKAGMALLHIQ